LYSKNIKIAGYHGTYPDCLDGILSNNFFESNDEDIWLGKGVYFFVDGIGALNPKEYSYLYSVDRCWDNIKKEYTKEYSIVLEAIIKIPEKKYLDLTKDEGLYLFNTFRADSIKAIESKGLKSKIEYKDSDILKIMREILGIEIVKSNVYIKFAIQRIAKMESRIPNVTILVVNNPTKNILKPSIKEVDKKRIE